MHKRLAIYSSIVYNANWKQNIRKVLRGRVQFPTGGIVRDPYI